MWRYYDKVYQRVMWCKEHLQIGDFVKCSGTRAGDWNKIESFDAQNITGFKYSKPKEGFIRPTASANGIDKVIKFVRNGVEILK